MFWVPQSGRLGLGVSILSYNGQVWLGTITDAGLVPDPDSIISAFHAEFDELLDQARNAQDTRQLRQATTGPGKVGESHRETRGAEVADEPASDSESCRALTRAGKRCRNRPQPASDFCYLHQDQQG